MKKVMFLMLIGLVLGGCSVTPKLIEEASTINLHNTVYPYCSNINLKDANPNIIVVQDGANPYTLYSHTLTLNGSDCVDLYTHQKVSIKLPSGEYMVGIKFGEISHEIPITVGKNLVVIREGIDSGTMFIHRASK